MTGMRKVFCIWEVGSKADSFDYLRKIILNEKTLVKEESDKKRRKSPEKILFQKYDYDCGGGIFCTALIMVGREDVLKTDVYSRLEVNPIDGTKSENMKKLCEEEQIEYLEFWEASLDDVENVLNNHGVVITSYQSEGTEEEVKKLECGHYSLIYDIDAESVWLIDPSWDEEYISGFGNGVVRRSREEFEKLWIDKGVDGAIYKKWMMAIRRNQTDSL